MNGFYKVNYYIDFDIKEDCGVVVAEDEAEMVRRLKNYYGDLDEIRLRFTENCDADVVPQECFVDSIKFNT